MNVLLDAMVRLCGNVVLINIATDLLVEELNSPCFTSYPSLIQKDGGVRVLLF